MLISRPILTIVWRREDGDKSSTGKEFVAILHNLVCPAYEIQVVLPAEALHYAGAKGEGYPSVIVTPSARFLEWVRPQEIAQQA
eukprot:6073618-Amphidinium_carterae.1